MDPPHPPHHHRIHLRLDPGHHHRIHIHLRHHAAHLPAAAPCAHHHHHHTSVPLPPPRPLPHPPTAAEGPLPGPQGEAARDAEEPAPQAERGEEVYLGQEGWEKEEEEPVFVLTEEWAEFFAKADAKRRLAKQQRKNRKK